MCTVKLYSTEATVKQKLRSWDVVSKRTTTLTHHTQRSHKTSHSDTPHQHS